MVKLIVAISVACSGGMSIRYHTVVFLFAWLLVRTGAVAERREGSIIEVYRYSLAVYILCQAWARIPTPENQSAQTAGPRFCDHLLRVVHKNSHLLSRSCIHHVECQFVCKL